MTDARLATARLRDEEAGLEATFVPGANMLCCSLRHRGEELLAQNDGVDAYSRRGKTMGIPLLYPWANRLATFDYSILAGQTVQVPHDPTRIAVDNNGLPIHGVIGGRLGWELIDPPVPDLTRGSETRALAARLNWSEEQPELFEVFPFEHDLLYEARFTDGRLEVEMTVHASGEDVVPVAFGFHPYLAPGGPRERWLIELPEMRHLALDPNQIPIGPDSTKPDLTKPDSTKPYPSKPDLTKPDSTGPGQASIPQRFELGERELDDGFDSVADPARFAVTAGSRRVAIELTDGYPCAQVYAPLGGHFVCFEPMTAPANALRSGDGLRLLQPGERYRAGFSLRVGDPPSSSGSAPPRD
jgi:aldose 1-epimerase